MSGTLPDPPGDATRLLQQAAAGEHAAAADLLPLVYDELRTLAGAYFRDEQGDHTLQPTALVHEAFLKLVGDRGIAWESRAQFFVIAAKAMRHVLIDHARTRGRQKRGGQWGRVSVNVAEAAVARGRADTPGGDPNDLMDVERLDQALEALAALDERAARLVELRFFAGLDEREAAEVLGIARSTASESWRFARAWLHRRIRGAEGDGDRPGGTS